MPLFRNLEELNPDLTPEVISKVDAIIEGKRKKKGALIPVLAGCQEVVGYLPVELQEYIGQSLNIPGSDIYGVVTFYSFFTMFPKGRHTIKVCLGTACYVRGSKQILEKISSVFKIGVGETTEDRRFSLEAVRCLGACGLAPVVVVDDDTHGSVTPGAILEVLDRYE
jgi:NADH:ubiquinone oxidoreductase subunit E